LKTRNSDERRGRSSLRSSIFREHPLLRDL
jgi:hypothetical protein